MGKTTKTQFTVQPLEEPQKNIYGIGVENALLLKEKYTRGDVLRGEMVESN